MPPPLLTAPMLPLTTFCSIVVAPAKSTMPKSKPSMNRPRIVLPGVSSVARPQSPGLPLSSISGVPAYPGCEVPSRTTGSVSVGSPDCGVIVCTPLPGMLNVMVSSVAAVRVRFENRLPQRPGAAVVGVGHDQRAAVAVTVVVSNAVLLAGVGSAVVRVALATSVNVAAGEGGHVGLEIERFARLQRRQGAGDVLIRQPRTTRPPMRREARRRPRRGPRATANGQVQRRAGAVAGPWLVTRPRRSETPPSATGSAESCSGDGQIAGRLAAGAEQHLNAPDGSATAMSS